MTSYDQEELWKVRMRELSGAIAVSALFQVFLGYSGKCNIVHHNIISYTAETTSSFLGLNI